MELAGKYGIMQAPTLVVVNEEGFKKYVNASNIKKFAQERSMAVL
jgi:ribonucleoside-triphosphate reductase